MFVILNRFPPVSLAGMGATFNSSSMALHTIQTCRGITGHIISLSSANSLGYCIQISHNALQLVAELTWRVPDPAEQMAYCASQIESKLSRAKSSAT